MTNFTPPQSRNNQIDHLHKLLDSELLKSASLAWELAPIHCPSDIQGKQLCLDYHRIWQFLLAFGITKSLRTDSDFLINSFKDCFKHTGHCRILVTGTADYSLLSHILWAAKLEGVTPSVTVLDRCETSLELNRWYAKRQGVNIKTVQQDVLEFVAEKPYNCICTHSFLGWFSLSGRPKLLRSWHDNLDDKGMVITTARLRPNSSPGTCRPFDEQEILELQKSVQKAAEHHVASKSIGTAELLAAVYGYCKSRHRYSISTEEMLVELFEQASFNITFLDQEKRTETIANRPSGPVKGAGNRVNIIAIKR